MGGRRRDSTWNRSWTSVSTWGKLIVESYQGGSSAHTGVWLVRFVDLPILSMRHQFSACCFAGVELGGKHEVLVRHGRHGQTRDSRPLAEFRQRQGGGMILNNSGSSRVFFFSKRMRSEIGSTSHAPSPALPLFGATPPSSSDFALAKLMLHLSLECVQLRAWSCIRRVLLRAIGGASFSGGEAATGE